MLVFLSSETLKIIGLKFQPVLKFFYSLQLKTLQLLSRVIKFISIFSVKNSKQEIQKFQEKTIRKFKQSKNKYWKTKKL